MIMEVTDEMEKDVWRRRTLTILKQLSEGQTFKLPDGHEIGMSEDMVIGYLVGKGKIIEGKLIESNVKVIGALSEMSVKDLFNLVKGHELIPIPV